MDKILRYEIELLKAKLEELMPTDQFLNFLLEVNDLVNAEMAGDPTAMDPQTEQVLTCSDCPPDECTGHCFSCPYGAQ